MKFLKNDFKEIIQQLRESDKKVILILLSTAILQTISWYYTSRRFFRQNLYYTVFFGNEDVKLIEFLFWFITDFLTFFVVPIIIIKFLLKEKPKEYGLRIGDYGLGLKYSAISIVVMFVIIWFVSANQEFAKSYPHLSSAKSNITHLIIYEIGILIYLVAWEFIWRGFMLVGLKHKFGIHSIFIQMLPFVILHNGKPQLETFGAILGALLLGALAFRTRSFIYGVIIHFGVMLSIDILSILRYQSGEYGISLSALVKVILNN